MNLKLTTKVHHNLKSINPKKKVVRFQKQRNGGPNVPENILQTTKNEKQGNMYYV